MRPPLALAAAVAALAAALLAAPAAGWRTRGAVESLPPACGADLDALLAAHYPDVKLPSGATAPSECGATVREALRVNVTAKCPEEATLVACLNTARDAWTSFVAKCELFAGVPAGAAAPASPTRRLTAAAEAEGEGEGEGEGDGASLDGQGCFPAFGTAADFGAWLDGNFKEPLRYGKASPVAIASVVVFAGALLSMAAL